MLDFGDLLKKDQKDSTATSSSKNSLGAIQFYRTDEVRILIEETFRFDGHEPPITQPYKFKDVAVQVEENKAQLAVIDLIGCPDTLKECRQLSARLPTSLSIIIIGDVDSISVVRELKSLGFYYLLWPVDKVDLAEFVQSVVSRHIETSSLKNRRRAKRVGIVGTRGGVGASLLTAELSWVLTNDKQTSCMVVDHNYLSGNLDLLLGLKNRDKRRLTDNEVGTELDHTSAKSLVTRISNRLDYLALGLNNESSADLFETNSLVVSYLTSETNFILDDLSSSVSFDVQPHTIHQMLDVAVIVMEPTISCLRETSAMLNKLAKQTQEAERPKNFRTLLVLNQHRAPRFASVTQAEVEKYLNRPVDIVLPYETKLEEFLVSGTNPGSTKSKFGGEVRRLCSLIIGEDLSPKRKPLFSLPRLGGK
ncbi:Type II/IV secretion system ATPase TadZ/CpaE, associated with Flp pilus assembly [Grimontia indica]|uniref:Type II/IV secretion system ATPase TadZ/CpaE, associated with Flp pilus assembly n=1 Tax=Grimontia indica TaxID=1056512 RepID=R1IMR2_9GAMM|nr:MULTISPECIES: type II/IV secretion system ATPase TadZ/CpaE, associated with Flp pilus assembly [Grimontia]EOD78767.1 Type II/IV secretion system ATPase TadZ/CpaE, associated with Flp pilus assembly [Grimontia indica]